MSTKAVVTNAILSHTQLKNAFVDSMLRKTIVRTVTATAVLSGYRVGVATGAVLRKTEIKTAAGTGVLRKTVLGTFSGNSALMRRITGTFITNGILKRGRKRKGNTVLANGVEATFSAGAVLFPATSRRQLTTIGRLVLQRQGTLKTVTASAVKVPQVLARTKTVTSSASLFKAGRQLGVQTTAVLVRSGARSPRTQFSQFNARTSRR